MKDEEIREPGGWRPPVLLSGAALLFWGFLTGHPVLGILLGAALESHRIIISRWELSDDLFSRIWNFCFIMFGGTAVISMFRVGATQAVYVCIEWQPVLMFPLAMAQVYATRDRLPMSSFSFIARYMQSAETPAGGKPRREKKLNLEYLYVAMVFVAASMANSEGPWFYIGTLCFAAWAVWLHPSRPKVGIVTFAAGVLVAGATGYAGYIGLHILHVKLEENAFLFMSKQNDLNPNRAITRIGSVGELKLSSAIVWRMQPEKGSAPLYLRQAAYNIYRRGLWLARKAGPFMALARGEDGESWRLPGGSDQSDISVMLLSGRSRDGQVFLPLPGSPLEIRDLPAETVLRNEMSVVKAMDSPAYIDVSVDFRDNMKSDRGPGPDDLDVPEAEKEGLERIAARLGLDGADPDSSLRNLSRFFLQNFSYSTYLKGRETNHSQDETPLYRFLEKERSGHCEYFATATVLLLRQAGIPARYVTGYSVSEYNRKKNEFVIRGLHAHAWAQAWVDGKWRLVENTPPSWDDVESGSMSFLQPVKDWLSSIPHAFARWRKSPSGRRTVSVFKWAGIPLFILYLWIRIFKGQRSKRVKKGKKKTEHVLEIQGLDSDCFELEARLEGLVEGRHLSEPLRCWWKRVGWGMDTALASKVSKVIDLHYRHRFDPAGLDEGGRALLRELVKECVSSLPSAEPAA